ncbi:D-xylose transporter XylE [Maribellus luteus]|uniref:D-xylose transporter XylE n=1 Tax=Maribellus luteus TaxID=2305463 RepID=A0A399T9K7_9BACT|nr:D-xylose transporter XylE [Maribellus luteus]RIJ50897.1 D-xylose transporter XylE [Maribellus luteus]
MNTEQNRNVKTPRVVYLITATAVLGGFLFGYDTAVISGTIGALDQFFIQPQNFESTIGNWWLGFTVSAALIGCIVGAMSGGIISLKLGRRKAMMLSSVLFFISALGSAMPELGIDSIGSGNHTIWIPFILYRIVGGIGVGLASMLAPMYISEIVPANVRGRLVSWNQFAIVIGIFISFLVNYQIGQIGDASWQLSKGWRFMFGAEAIPAILYFSLLFTVPESPRWLVLKGQEKKAASVMCKILQEGDMAFQLKEIKNSFGTTSPKLLSFGCRVLFIGGALAVFQQFIGINVVLYYAPEIFKSIGVKGDQALFQSVVVGLTNMLFTIVAIKNVDRFGRKPLMLIGAIGMGGAMICLGASFFLNSNGIFALVFMLMFVASFAMSWGPVTWVLIAEIFPNSIRGRAMSIATAAMWISNFMVSQTFPVLDKHQVLIAKFNHGFAYWVYGAIALLSFAFIWKFVPETKGKTLEEMEGFWKKDRS